jgi:hypothetical protein
MHGALAGQDQTKSDSGINMSTAPANDNNQKTSRANNTNLPAHVGRGVNEHHDAYAKRQRAEQVVGCRTGSAGAAASITVHQRSEISTRQKMIEDRLKNAHKEKRRHELGEHRL